MKAKTFLRPAVLAIGLFVLRSGQAQVSVDQNFPNNPGVDYVGWDNTTNVPLEIRHDNNQPIEWYTQATKRMQLNHNASYTIGSFSTQGAGGYLGLSPDGSLWNPLYANGPFSRLHIHDGKTIVQAAGYRPWMRN